MKTATEVLDAIFQHGLDNADDSAVTIGAIGPGDHTAQGDVLFWPLESLPQGCKLSESSERQLAPGTTKGSRHLIAERDFAKCKLYTLANPNALQGPVIDARKSGFTVEHPEHGNQTFTPGIYFVTYQRSYAQELRRVLD